MRIIYIFFSVLITIILFLNENLILPWIAIGNVVIQIILLVSIPNIVAKNAIQRNKSRLDEILKQQLPKEEKDKLLQQEVSIKNEDRESIANWITYVSIVSLALSVVLLIVGLVFPNFM